MKDLQSFFENPFSDVRISLNRKKKFGEDHIQRISVQNTTGQFDQMLEDTVAVQSALFGSMTSVDSNTAIREARTQTVDAVMDAFKARNTRLNSYFIATEVKGKPVYKEFFPQGVQAFTRDINKENIEQRMEEMVTAINANTAVAGGAPVLTEYQQLLANYKTARSSQLNKAAEVDSGGDKDLDKKEAAWNDQVFNNLLTVANLYRDQPDSLSLFMDQSILRAPQDAHAGKGELVGTVTDAKGNPVGGVLVHVIDGDIDDATTDDAGSYRTQYLPVGSYEVRYSKEGIAPVVVTIAITDSGNTVHNLVIGS